MTEPHVYFLREKVINKNLIIYHTKATDQNIYMFPKPLSFPWFGLSREKLGV